MTQKNLKNFQISSFLIGTVISFGILLIFLVFYYSDFLNSLLNNPPLQIQELKLNFDAVAFGLFSASIGFPVVAQFIRRAIDDLDTILPAIQDKMEDKNLDLESSERLRLENIRSHINETIRTLREFYAFQHYKAYIVISIVFLYISFTNNWINESSLEPNARLLLVTNFSVLVFSIITCVFMFIKTLKIHNFLRKERKAVNAIHRMRTLSPSERILEEMEGN